MRRRTVALALIALSSMAHLRQAQAQDLPGREAQRIVTIGATRLTEGLVIDGRLDEAIYARLPATGGFIQQEPHEGEPATEATDAWIFFDDRSLYVAARLWDSQPDRIIATEMRRDNWNISRGASFTVALDTFHDRRNGFIFQTNPLGALRDAQVTDERNENDDWNTIWYTRSASFEQGWTVEMAIPFKSLRYRGGADQVWGINLQRTVRWKNERSFLSAVPAAFSFGGIDRFSHAAILRGVQTPAGSKNLEVKPYAISTLSTDRRADPVVSNDLAGDAGFDVKYGLTRGLTADFTVNTDFAQVEADEEQVNLTRFSLFFPEKREFFLEGQGLFTFGGRQATAWGPGGDTPILFYSRRIGIHDGRIVPTRGGTRLTGRVGKYTVGLLDIQTGASETAGAASTNFSVVRLRRDILHRSTIGVIGTHRSVSLDGTGSNQAFGVDANLAFYQNLRIDAYYAETRTPGRAGAEASYRGRIANTGDRYGFEYEHLVVGENFNPEIGFLRRRDFRLNHAALDFTPRVPSSDAVRKLQFGLTVDRYTNGTGVLETRNVEGRVGIELESGDDWSVEYTSTHEFLDRPFWIASGVTVPVGQYNFQQVRTSYQLGQQRPVSGWLSAGHGSFWDGTRSQVGYRGRVEISARFSLEPRVQLDWVDLSSGSFVSTLLGSRVTYTVSPRTFVGALVQYNSSSHTVSTNVRLRWEYEPGSDLFIVYSEGRDTGTFGDPHRTAGLQSRGLAIKMTHLWRY